MRSKAYKGYEVFEDGSVNGKRGEKLKPFSTKAGYKQVDLYCEKKERWYVHRLVATLFIDNTNNKEEINHINGVKSDNNVENLEWCTRTENANHMFDTGLFKRRSLQAYNLNTGFGLFFPAVREAVSCGFHRGEISRVCNGRVKYYKGYKWSYL